jgi:phosphoglycerate kinase
MKFGIKTLDDIDVKGKTVLCRIDINQPVDRAAGRLKDETRIAACTPTLVELSAKGAKLVLLAHQGSDIEYENYWTTAPHAEVLTRLLGREVKFIDDVWGPAAREEIKKLREGEILLLDNVRFAAEEQTLFEKNLKLSHEEQAATLLVRKLAPLADLYVCDAFAAAHRDQPSLCGFEQVLPSAMGRLFEEEYSIISGLMENPVQPCVFVLGGSKISDAFLMMETVLKNGTANKVLSGGLAGQVLLWASGADIGEASRSLIEKKGYGGMVEIGMTLLASYREKIVMPSDIAYVKGGKHIECTVDSIPPEEIILDIGTATSEKYQEIIRAAKTVFVNGPPGVFEDAASEKGTNMVWEALGDTAGYTVIGGGDSIAAVKKYKKTSSINYICTGGGALVRFLSGEELPVVKALKHGSALRQKSGGL